MLLLVKFLILFSIQLSADPISDLYSSIWKKDSLLLKNALEKGADINYGNEWNTTPLMLAVNYDIYEMGKVLLENGANPNLINYAGESALKLSINKNNRRFFQLLVDRGAEINEEDVKGQNLIMQILLEKKMKLEDKLEFAKILHRGGIRLNHRREDGFTATMLSIYENEPVFLKFLLDIGANPNIGDLEGITPLMHAIEHKKWDLVKILVENGTDLNRVDLKGYNALQYAVLMDHNPTSYLLIEKGADFKRKSIRGYTLLMLSAFRGNTEFVKYLLSKGVSPEDQTPLGETALYHAIRNYKNRHYETARLILDSKKALFKGKVWKDAGVFASAHFNDIKAMEYFTENGFDINIQDEEGNTPLHIASEKGNTDLVKFLIDNGAKTNIKNNRKETASQVAATKGNHETAEILNPEYIPDPKLVKKPNYKKDVHFPVNISSATIDSNLLELIKNDKKDSVSEIITKQPFLLKEQFKPFGTNMLMYAAYHGSWKTVKLLAASGSDLSQKDIHGNDSLLYIIKSARLEEEYTIQPGHFLSLRILLDAGVSPNTRDVEGKTILHYLVYQGHFNLVKYFLNRGSDPNIKDNDGVTPLHLAAQEQNRRIAELLLQHNADINAGDNENRTPFWQLCANGDTDTLLFNLFINKKPDLTIKTKNGESLLERIKQSGYEKFFPEAVKSYPEEKLVLEEEEKEYKIMQKQFSGKGVNWRNEKGLTLLELAVKYAKLQDVKTLLEKKAQVNLKNQEGETPLMIASEKGNLEIASLLIEYGADVNVKSKIGNTCLMSSAFHGNEELAKILVKRGAIPSVKNEFGDSALTIAAKYGNKSIVEFLLSERVNPNIANKNGGTALMAASRAGDREIVEILLQKRANPNLRYSDGANALVFAIEKEHLDIMKILIKNRAKSDIQLRKNRSLLRSGVETGNEEVVQLLIEEGVALRTRKENFIPVLHFAVFAGKPKIVSMILDSKFRSPDITDKEFNELINSKSSGITPLILASALGDKAIVELLLNYNPDKKLTDAEGKDAAFYASEMGFKEILELVK